MPRGFSPEREREYEELVQQFKHDGRYPGREEEVAARIVNKQRAELHEIKEDEEAAQRGEAHNPDLPIQSYDHLTIEEITSHLDGLTPQQLKRIRAYEEKHRHRVTLLEHLECITAPA